MDFLFLSQRLPLVLSLWTHIQVSQRSALGYPPNELWMYYRQAVLIINRKFLPRAIYIPKYCMSQSCHLLRTTICRSKEPKKEDSKDYLGRVYCIISEPNPLIPLKKYMRWKSTRISSCNDSETWNVQTQSRPNWTEEVKFIENNHYNGKFLEILSKFKDLWDWLDWIRSVKHQINLTLADARPIHSAT